MGYEFRLATTDEDREAVYRFRYDVYVEELGRYRAIADHQARTFTEPEDDHSRIFCAIRAGEVVGTARYTWGAAGFSRRQVDQYHLQPFLDELPVEILAVGERLMIDPGLRGTSLMQQMMDAVRESAGDLPIEIVFGACEPHLLSLYIAQGQRPYADRNINSPESGYLIPMLTILNDLDAIVGDGPVPACLTPVLDGSGAVTSQGLTASGAYLGEVQGALAEMADDEITTLEGLSETEIERCLARSNIVACASGDRVLKRGGTARNLFMVLEGLLEVRDDDRVVGELGEGDVFGEMAFLLNQPRAFDVYATAPGTRVLSLSEREIRQLIETDPGVAATLLLNISKMLCRRLIRAG